VASLLMSVAKFSETMLWIVGTLFVADFAALMIAVVRSGKVDQEEGRVVSEQMPLSGNVRNEMGGDVTVAGTGRAKKRIFLSRPAFISDESLVDGTATKYQRLIVHGIKLALFLFWLLFIFGILTVLPSNPIAGLAGIAMFSIIFFKAAALMHKGRADALRKQKAKVGPRKVEDRA
jgi:hypothetical protein